MNKFEQQWSVIGVGEGELVTYHNAPWPKMPSRPKVENYIMLSRCYQISSNSVIEGTDYRFIEIGYKMTYLRPTCFTQEPIF